MYMKQMLTIGKAVNGYVIECHVPIKEDDKEEADGMMSYKSDSCEKQFIATSAPDVIKLVERLMPMLDEEFTDEEAFDAAFKEAAKGK